MNKILLFIILISHLGACKAIPTNQNPPTEKPVNLLVIMTDEHNFRTLGCYRNTLPPEQALMWGNTVVETPNIDWLAENGALCTSFYVNTPVCAPSRAAFVSGKYPQNTPVDGNDIPLADDIITFAEVLKNEKYATGYVGKWHLDGEAKPGWAPERKFGFTDNKYMFNRGHWKQLEDGKTGPAVVTKNKKGKPNYSINGANEKNFSTDFLTNKTIDFIEKNKSNPFCVMLSLPDPHGPNTVRPPYDKMFKESDFVQAKTFEAPYDLPIEKRAPFQIKRHKMAEYFGMVKCIDDNIGNILQHLRENNLLENTIIVFTSDHGDMCGEHGRINKGIPYEASAKVPFIVYYPKKIKQGKVIHQAMSSVDFMPTILSLMGKKTPTTVEGRNAISLFTETPTKIPWKDLAIVRGVPRTGWIAAFTDRYKLVYYKDKKPSLFDLEKDPDELINFYEDAEYQSIIKDLSAEIKAYGEKNKEEHLKNENIQKYINAH
jgi:arylsulfatase A-like enzyme